MHLFDLREKIAIVTGGAQGLGAAAVRALEQAGARVAVFDLIAVNESSVDVTREADVRDAFERVSKELGGIDILVNNAGRAARKPAIDLTVDEWNSVLSVNLTGIFICSKHVHPFMKKRGGGSIVNLASIMGFSGGLFPNPAYQASKGGVVNLTRALALEWAADNIRVNAVAPTFVRTDLTTPIFSNPERLATVMAHTPLGRLPEPEDVAAAIVYLCSPAARCITGIALPVDSGYLAR
jgi:NAD(P)-dependent dehydrogenase (short-subunit alcohol dehydrogenase family)